MADLSCVEARVALEKIGGGGDAARGLPHACGLQTPHTGASLWHLFEFEGGGCWQQGEHRRRRASKTLSQPQDQVGAYYYTKLVIV